jgi:hypothetical protein
MEILAVFAVSRENRRKMAEEMQKASFIDACSIGKTGLCLSLAASFVLLGAFPLNASEPAIEGRGSVQLQAFSPGNRFTDSARKQALSLACASDVKSLSRYFQTQNLPFDPHLIREQKAEVCHVFFRPTVAGFRAHAESDPITALRFTFESRAFLAGRALGLGDSLDIAKTLLKRTAEPLEVSIHTMLDLSPDLHAAAQLQHFPLSRHQIELHHNPAPTENIWAQDYLKSGNVGSLPVWLVPYRAFEGRPENGERFRLMLDSLEADGSVRSKISWDGGDLLVLRHPADPERLLLFYGSAGKGYWAENLSLEEYGYVLRVEFGADQAIYAGDVASHVDYAMNVLPDGRTVLLATPVTRNFSLSVLTFNQLLQEHGRVPLLAELDRVLADEQTAFGDQREHALRLLRRAVKEHAKWPRAVDVPALERARAYATLNCPDSIEDCGSSAGLARMIRTEPELARDWVGAVSALRMGAVVSSSLLGVLASQIAEPDAEKLVRVSSLRAMLEAMGFRVILVPSIAGNSSSMVPWAGISYTNFLAIGHEIFMPVFGFGQQETVMLSEIQRQLPTGYQIVPVFARYALASNGGVHCVVGVMRRPHEVNRPVSGNPAFFTNLYAPPDFSPADELRMAR